MYNTIYEIIAFLDIKDALDLSEHIESMMATASTRRRTRSSTVEHASETLIRVRNHPTVVFVFKAMLAASVCCGLSLGGYALSSYFGQRADCVKRIGPLATCASPKLYYRDGLFNKTTCAFENVTAFKCSGQQDWTSLPEDDLDGDFPSMGKLTLINVSNSSLQRAPRTWAKVPKIGELIVDLWGSSLEPAGLPFVFCDNGTDLKAIHLGNTEVQRTLDWDGELLTPPRKFLLNAACKAALAPTVEQLSLARNGMLAEDFDSESELIEFKALRQLDLSGNDIEDLRISRRGSGSDHSSVFGPIVARYMRQLESNATTDDTDHTGGELVAAEGTQSGIVLLDNPLRAAEFEWLPFTVANAWWGTIRGAGNRLPALRGLSFVECGIQNVAKDALALMTRLRFFIVSTDVGFNIDKCDTWGLPPAAVVCTQQEGVGIHGGIEIDSSCRFANACPSAQQNGAGEVSAFATECHCGDTDCTAATGLACHQSTISTNTSGHCTHTTRVCADTSGASENSGVCRCGDVDCWAGTGLFCSSEQNRCSSQKITRPCERVDASIANDDDCACGNVAHGYSECNAASGRFCRAEQSFCDNHTNLRRVYPVVDSGECTDRAGFEWIDDAATCASAASTSRNNIIANSYVASAPRGCIRIAFDQVLFNSIAFAAHKCGKASHACLCSFVGLECHGETINAEPCVCGTSGVCTSTTGLFCYAPQSLCAEYAHPRRVYPIVTSGMCTGNGYEWIADAATCQAAAGQVGWSDTVASITSWSGFPRGCFDQRSSSSGGNLKFNTNPSSTGYCGSSNSEACLCAAFTAPACTHDNGTTVNPNHCVCGASGACTSATGLFCASSLNACAAHSRRRRATEWPRSHLPLPGG